MANARIESWRDLVVWQQAHEATLLVYRATQRFPPDERYRLTDQLCRAASSIPTNIAEGKGRNTKAEFRQFLIIARGSTEETRYLLLLAKDLGYLQPETYSDFEERYTAVSKMLNGLLRAIPA
jgi:four helix bundle protein